MQQVRKLLLHALQVSNIRLKCSSALMLCRDQRGDGSSDDGPGGSTIVSELSLGEGIGRARPSRTQSAGSRLKSAPATPFSALLHAAARNGPAPGLEEKMPRVGSFPGAGKRLLDPTDLELGPQQKRARTMLLPEMIHDSPQMSYRPTEPGTLLIVPCISFSECIECRSSVDTARLTQLVYPTNCC